MNSQRKKHALKQTGQRVSSQHSERAPVAGPGDHMILIELFIALVLLFLFTVFIAKVAMAAVLTTTSVLENGLFPFSWIRRKLTGGSEEEMVLRVIAGIAISKLIAAGVFSAAAFWLGASAKTTLYTALAAFFFIG